MILPPYVRRSPKVSEVLPLLYLHGLSSGDFIPALEEFFGTDSGLSASTITRLTESWHSERESFMRRSLKRRDYVYVWVDGIHTGVRLGGDDRLCCLVMVGARLDGRKELVATNKTATGSPPRVGRSSVERSEEARDESPGAGRRRRSFGLLGRHPGRLPHDSPSARLGAQNLQRSRLATQERPWQGEGSHQGDDRGRRQKARREGHRGICLRVRCKVAQGSLEDRRGQGCSAHLLRLPGSSLAAFEDHQPHRVSLRTGQSEDRHHQGAGLERGRAFDDLQADRGRRGKVAQTGRRSLGGTGQGGSKVRGWRASRKKRREGRRVIRERSTTAKIWKATISERPDP